MRSVRLPILVPHFVGSAFDSTNALRFRGPDAAAEFFTLRGVQTVKLIAGDRHFVCEARCVNRQRSDNHKVPRCRSRFTVVLRGSVRARVVAGSSIERVGFRRCVGGKAPKPASLWCGPSFNAAIEETVGAKGQTQLRGRLARGNLTTASSRV